MEGIQSILLGTAGLALTAAVALILARATALPPTGGLGPVFRAAGFAVAAQAAHFCEEWLSGFPDRFPALLGLTPWPPAFFVAFNLAWLAAWIFVLVRPLVWPRFTLFALWFLALAGLINGVAHPLLALAAGAYFPGLWTAPLLGAAGIILLLALGRMRRSHPRE
jgi:hypothetical protein